MSYDFVAYLSVYDRYELRIMYRVFVCRYMCLCCCFFFQAEDGIRDLVRSRGLGDVYKRQAGAGAGRRPAGLCQESLRLPVAGGAVRPLVALGGLSLIHI